MAAQQIPAVGSHVLFSGGKKSGKVTTLVTADDSEKVVGFIVHYGWRGQKAKLVPIEKVKWVNTDSVVLTMSRKQFDALDEWSAPAHSESAVPDSTAHGNTIAHRPAHD